LRMSWDNWISKHLFLKTSKHVKQMKSF
jgi:hypothetical protein